MPAIKPISDLRNYTEVLKEVGNVGDGLFMIHIRGTKKTVPLFPNPKNS